MADSQRDLSDTTRLTMDLIRRRSVTPEDAGCQDLMVGHLEALGFRVERMHFGSVRNFWARHGDQGPLFVFAGHTDVVPPGPIEAWETDPFDPDLRDGMLHGRGAADMKSSLASMIVACRRFVTEHPNHKGSIGFLITSDEEGAAVDGTVRVVEALQRRGEDIDMCLVGEPSSQEHLGDVIKNGRRGSLNGHLVVKGIQGHVAYPHLASNPVHAFAPALAELCAQEWDQGNEHFPATSFQVSNLQSGTGAENVIPGRLEALFNFRFSTELDAGTIAARVEGILNRHDLRYELSWRLSGTPFLTPQGSLIDGVVAAVTEATGRTPELSTSGGTSDGRFIAPTGAQVVELGHLNATIHKANECVAVADLDALTGIYQKILEKLLT